VTSETSGPPAALSPGVDLTAYRIIQEALTNVVRHAPGATAAVRVTYEPSHVCVEVTNSAPARAPGRVPAGRTAQAGPAGPGYGLAGIAERVASCGGALSLGPAADGGFAVRSRLPVT
jgi:signal transduction histidine kinase